jgi:nucleoside-diphosphate-sugar epimerase
LEETLVLGGSGFIGRAVQKQVLDQGLADKFIFSYAKNPERISKGLRKEHYDLLAPHVGEALRGPKQALFLAGNADHRLAEEDPSLDLTLNVGSFLGLMSGFKGRLVLLSSQALYYGLEGRVGEAVEHLPETTYGISKQMVEAYAKYYLATRTLESLWIFRLSYAFGEGERADRLIPRCASATRAGGAVTVYGGGKSFLNPLPADFVARVLLKAIELPPPTKGARVEITNLNHREPMKVRDVVSLLKSVQRFDINLVEEERWPVKFWGETGNLEGHLSKWRMSFPDIEVSLKSYFQELTKRE